MGGEMNWQTALQHYTEYLTAIGRPKTTIDLRRFQLAYLAKSLNKAPGRPTV